MILPFVANLAELAAAIRVARPCLRSGRRPDAGPDGAPRSCCRPRIAEATAAAAGGCCIEPGRWPRRAPRRSPPLSTASGLRWLAPRCEAFPDDFGGRLAAPAALRGCRSCRRERSSVVRRYLLIDDIAADRRSIPSRPRVRVFQPSLAPHREWLKAPMTITPQRNSSISILLQRPGRVIGATLARPVRRQAGRHRCAAGMGGSETSRVVPILPANPTGPARRRRAVMIQDGAFTMCAAGGNGGATKVGRRHGQRAW
jgi:hypothetical protein